MSFVGRVFVFACFFVMHSCASGESDLELPDVGILLDEGQEAVDSSALEDSDAPVPQPDAVRPSDLEVVKDVVDDFGNALEDTWIEGDTDTLVEDSLGSETTVVLPVMVTIPAGSFMMGSPPGEAGQDASEELPQHLVSLTRSFEMQATEVSQEEWKMFMGNDPSRFVGCGANCPVEQVSWWGALAYSNALSSAAGYSECYELMGCTGTPGVDFKCGGVVFLGLDCSGFRLPTEAEWEYAARAGSDEPLYTGPMTINGYCDAPELAEIAWFCANSQVTYEGASDCPSFPGIEPSGVCGPRPVALKPATLWGVYDILGNVGEWTWDRYGETYYQVSPEVDPLGVFDGVHQVARGCSWRNGAGDCRSAARGSFTPGVRWDFLGFRPVRTLPAK